MRKIALVMLILFASTVSMAQQKGGSTKSVPAPVSFYDSTGKFFGVAYSNFGNYNSVGGAMVPADYALVQIGADIVGVVMRTSLSAPYGTFLPLETGTVQYVSTDCSGPGYIFRADLLGATRPSVVFQLQTGSWVIYVGSPVAPTTVQVGSQRSGGGCYTYPELRQASGQVPVTASEINLSAQWIPPFTAK